MKLSKLGTHLSYVQVLMKPRLSTLIILPMFPIKPRCMMGYLCCLSSSTSTPCCVRLISSGSTYSGWGITQGQISQLHRILGWGVGVGRHQTRADYSVKPAAGIDKGRLLSYYNINRLWVQARADYSVTTVYNDCGVRQGQITQLLQYTLTVGSDKGRLLSYYSIHWLWGQTRADYTVTTVYIDWGLTRADYSVTTVYIDCGVRQGQITQLLQYTLTVGSHKGRLLSYYKIQRLWG